MHDSHGNMPLNKAIQGGVTESKVVPFCLLKGNCPTIERDQ